ncbi:MAG: hypothetical protein ACMUIU_17155 [bacterium]
MSKAEGIKRLSMVELLSRHYGMEFRKVGGHYISLSPFTAHFSRNLSIYTFLEL